MTFRRRILIAMVPLFVLLVALGATGTFLIKQLGDQVGKILTENYDSVVFMRDLNEALERIDSSFQFALVGHQRESFKQYQDNWEKYQESLAHEQRNVTLPGEANLVATLTELSTLYRDLGDKFYKDPAADRDALYFGEGKKKGQVPEKGQAAERAPTSAKAQPPDQGQENKALYVLFQEIKTVSGDILRLNEQNMRDVDNHTKRLARSLLIWYGLGLACGILLAAFLVANTIRMIASPVRAVTESAVAIGAGNLDQVVPITSDDELGQLAATFNTMARQLREYRQSHKAQLIRAQQTSQATIDSFPEPVLVVDPEQRVEMANPAARRLFGLSRREGKAATMVWEPPEALRQPLTEALQTQREYIPEGFDKVIQLNVRDESRSFLPRLLPIRDPNGATLGAAVLLEDVTRFRLLDEVKSNMVATVSHELKTPLTSIRLVIHLLLEENAGPLNPKQVELLVDARENAERLLAMINNLLDLARLEQGAQLHFERVLPNALLQEAMDAFRPQAKDRGVNLVLQDLSDLAPVSVDKVQFQHALHNLLDNALAHTPTGGQVTLSAETADGHVAFSVIDNGSGIPPDYLPFVFEKYFRVPGDTTPGGSGLGLAIVREIVTAHGGKVDCQSCPGERTVFRMLIPVAMEPRNVHA